MKKKLTIFGTNHFKFDYNWIATKLEEINPDCITLEQRTDMSAILYWEFVKPLEEVIERQIEERYLGGEFSAGIHHSRKYNKPIFWIDEHESIKRVTSLNMNTNNNFEVLHKPHLKIDSIKESEYENFTRRNKFMGKALNLLLKTYRNIVHIGGSGHLNPKRCIALQGLVNANEIYLAYSPDNRIVQYKRAN